MIGLSGSRSSEYRNARIRNCRPSPIVKKSPTLQSDTEVAKLPRSSPSDENSRKRNTRPRLDARRPAHQYPFRRVLADRRQTQIASTVPHVSDEPTLDEQDEARLKEVLRVMDAFGAKAEAGRVHLSGSRRARPSEKDVPMDFSARAPVAQADGRPSARGIRHV